MPLLDFRSWINDFISLLFPRLCACCDESLIKGEENICIKCEYDLPYTDFHEHDDNALAKQFWGRVPFYQASALLYFTKGNKTQKLIHQFKYKNQPQIGFQLGKKIGERLKSTHATVAIDFIIPVPLHPKQLRKRGYNQSEQIANGIAAILNIPVATNILLKAKETSSQTKHERYNRFENLLRVFMIVKPALITNKHVLLVDDVVTTGATIEACAICLQQHQPSKLSLVAAAYTK